MKSFWVTLSLSLVLGATPVWAEHATDDSAVRPSLTSGSEDSDSSAVKTAIGELNDINPSSVGEQERPSVNQYLRGSLSEPTSPESIDEF